MSNNCYDYFSRGVASLSLEMIQITHVVYVCNKLNICNYNCQLACKTLNVV
jgi:hypothetical protein